MDLFIKIETVMSKKASKSIHYIDQNQFPSSSERAILVQAPRLILCLKGKRVYTNVTNNINKKIVLKAGDIVFHQPNTWLAPDNVKDFESIGIIFLPDKIELIYRNDSLKADALSSPNAYFSIKLNSDYMTKSLLNDIKKKSDNVFSNAERNKSIELLIIKACLCYLNNNSPKESKSKLTYTSIVKFMEENFHLPLDRVAISKEFKIHSNHISRLFKQYSNRTFNDFLLKVRLDNAILYLEKPNLNASEVSRLCGFTSNSYFTKCFKKVTGQTPYQFKISQKN